jgi:hypothetical protein
MFVNSLLKEREMKRRHYITIFSLIVALAGLSPVVGAGEERIADDESIQKTQRHFASPSGYKLSPEQMDKVHGGMYGPLPSIHYRIVNTDEEFTNEQGASSN